MSKPEKDSRGHQPISLSGTGNPNDNALLLAALSKGLTKGLLENAAKKSDKIRIARSSLDDGAAAARDEDKPSSISPLRSDTFPKEDFELAGFAGFTEVAGPAVSRTNSGAGAASDEWPDGVRRTNSGEDVFSEVESREPSRTHSLEQRPEIGGNYARVLANVQRRAAVADGHGLFSEGDRRAESLEQNRRPLGPYGASYRGGYGSGNPGGSSR